MRLSDEVKEIEEQHERDNRRGVYPPHDTLISHRARLLGHIKAQDWRPIETAPRDEKILLWVPGERYPLKGWWCKRHQWETYECGLISSDTPTHWQPLPASPHEGGSYERG